VGNIVDRVAPWQRRTTAFALVLLILTLWAAVQRGPALAIHLLQSQDIPVLFLLCFTTLVVAWWQPPPLRLPEWLPPNGVLAGAGVALAAALAWGTYSLMGNFPLSRDEHMVVFDMAVFGRGRLAIPIDPQWRPYALALVPRFLLNTSDPTGFVSAYLPMNALLRLAFSKVADPAWYNPVLVVVGAAALLDIARRTFGPDPRACWVVLLAYVLSSEVLVNAMTSFAMTAHLALNLVWLAAFLRGGRPWNALAIVVGFVAVGLHQLVFHPFFVAPFLLWKWRAGERRVVAVYVAAYAGICLWWAAYPMLISPLVADQGATASHANFITQRVLPLLLMHDPRALPLTLVNLLRFFAWQNLMVVPLLIAAVPVAMRERGLARALLLGAVTWTIFLALVLPEQGRGWGYRYLDGYEGSFALLAGYGYRSLEQQIGRRADGIAILLSGLTAVAAIPMLLATTYRLVQPHLAVERLIAAQPTPFVLVDDEQTESTDHRWTDSALDHVRNMPDLSNRPLRFSSEDLTPQMLVRLCRRGPVTPITRADMHRLGFELNAVERDPKFDALVFAARSAGAHCFASAVRPD
jgi:hypothetical protein